MRTLAFGSRTFKEVVRDPVSLLFGLAFPIMLLLLMTMINRNIPANVFDIDMLTPGIAVFGLSFMALFAGQIIAKDRASEFLTRLFTTPMTSKDFILGYTLPLVPMALLQTILCFAAALFLGLTLRISLVVSILSMLPIAVVFISSGLLIGSLLGEKAVGGVCGALLTNVTALFSGAWFNVELVGGAFEAIAYAIPFFHAVEMGRAAMAGEDASMLPHLWWVLGYAVAVTLIAVYVFRRKMKV